VPDFDLAIMRRLDQLHLEFPFAASRMLRGLLAAEGRKIGTAGRLVSNDEAVLLANRPIARRSRQIDIINFAETGMSLDLTRLYRAFFLFIFERLLKVH
jgi:hypothetical protein